MRTVATAAVALVTAMASAPAVLWLLRRLEVVDRPTARSSHDHTTPRGGGLAPAAGCLLAAGLSTRLSGADRTAVLVVAGGLGLIGLVDDLHPLGVAPRLLAQVAVAGISLVWLGRDLGGTPVVVGLAATAIAVWLVTYVNTFNFMDGINGLAVTQVIVAGVDWWIIGQRQHVPALAAAGLVAAGAAVGFAPYNLPRARMFLGDAGSYFLGGWLAATAIVGIRAGIAPEAMLAPLALFLADTTLTLARRVGRGDAWWQPHREHAYQRLVEGGWSHTRTTAILGLLMTAISAFGALSLTASVPLRVAGDGLGVLALIGYTALPSRLARRSRRSPAVAGP